jgi:hypothetical protein
VNGVSSASRRSGRSSRRRVTAGHAVIAWHTATTNPLIRAFADLVDTIHGDVSAELSA